MTHIIEADADKGIGPGGCYILPDGRYMPVEYHAHYMAERSYSEELCGYSHYDNGTPLRYVHYNVREHGGVRVSFGTSKDVYIEWYKEVTYDALRSLRRILGTLEGHGYNVGCDAHDDKYIDTSDEVGWSRVRTLVGRCIRKIRAEQREAAKKETDVATG